MTVPPGGGMQDHGGGGDHRYDQGVAGDQIAGAQSKSTYSDRLKTNVRFDQRLKRNVLEITLEKTDNNADLDDVGQEAIARVLKTLGIDIAAQTQGYQVHYKGKVSIVSVWMCAGINLDRFCKDISIKVSNGVMTGLIRPAGKTDVTVKVDGLDFNTPDNFVIDYLNKFGSVKSNTVTYSKYETGPFRGKYNGERRYQVDFGKASRQMGTFHLIDGAKVRVFYRGNKKTCGRCHKMADNCLGKAVAKGCGESGGERVFLSDHMKKLWAEIGFTPTTFELDADEKPEDDVQQATKDAPLIAATGYKPNVPRQEANVRDVERSNGITVRNFPPHLEDKDILTFLVNRGMPLNHENVNTTRGVKNTRALVEGLSPTDVQTLYRSIHYHETKTLFFDPSVPLYCQIVRNMTPTKKTEDAGATDSNEPNPNEENSVNTKPESPEQNPPNNPTSRSVRPKIPGLTEEDRLKSEKKKKRKKKNKQQKSEEEKHLNAMTINDFLVSPNSGIVKETDFVFSDYDESEEDESFEDSMETLGDDHEKENTKLVSPVNLAGAFAQTLVAKSTASPGPSSSSTPGTKSSARSKSSDPAAKQSAVKRKTSSPADDKEQKKKSRAQSVIPSKK